MPTASVNDTEIWYETQGSGHPLMLFPGLGMDHRYYRLGEPLLRESCMTVVVDPRGVGQSRKDDPGEVGYSAELWADDFAALAREAGWESVDILGSSLGGSTAQAMAVRHPDLVRSMIVVGGFSELDRAMELNFSLRKKIIARIGMGEELADFMGLSTMTREFMDTDEGLAIMRANQDNVRANDPDLYTAFLDSILSWGRRLPGQEDEPLWTEKIRSVLLPNARADRRQRLFHPGEVFEDHRRCDPRRGLCRDSRRRTHSFHREACGNGGSRRRFPRRAELSGSVEEAPSPGPSRKREGRR